MARPLTGEVSVTAWTDDRTRAVAVLTFPADPATPGQPGPQGYWQIVQLTGAGRSVYHWTVPVDQVALGPGESEDLNHMRAFFPHVYGWAFEVMQNHSTAPPTP